MADIPRTPEEIKAVHGVDDYTAVKMAREVGWQPNTANLSGLSPDAPRPSLVGGAPVANPGAIGRAFMSPAPLIQAPTLSLPPSAPPVAEMSSMAREKVDPAAAAKREAVVASLNPQAASTSAAVPGEAPRQTLNIAGAYGPQYTSPISWQQAVNQSLKFSGESNVGQLEKAELKSSQQRMLGLNQKTEGIKANALHDVGTLLGEAAKKREALGNELLSDAEKQALEEGKIRAGLETERQEIKNTKIDPMGYFKTKEGNLNGFAMIGLALSSFASGLGNKAAMDPIKMFIQNNVNAQSENLANKRHALSEGENLVDRFRRAGLDKNAAKAAAQYELLGAVQNQLQAMQANTDSAVTKENIPKLQEALNQELIQTDIALNKFIGADAARRQAASVMRIDHGGGISFESDDQKGFVPGAGVKIADPVKASELNANLAQRKRAAYLLRKAGDLSKTIHDKGYTLARAKDSDEWRELQSVKAQLIPVLSNTTGAGAPSEGDAGRNVKMLGEDEWFTRGNAPETLYRFADRQVPEWQEGVRAFGGTPAKKVVAYNPKTGRLGEGLTLTGEQAVDPLDSYDKPGAGTVATKKIGK